MQVAAGVAVVGSVGYLINFFAGANMGLLIIGARSVLSQACRLTIYVP